MKLKVAMKEFEMILLFVCAQRWCFRDGKRSSFVLLVRDDNIAFLSMEALCYDRKIVDIGADQGSHFSLRHAIQSSPKRPPGSC